MMYVLLHPSGSYLQRNDPRDPCAWGSFFGARVFGNPAAARAMAAECQAPNARPALVSKDGAVFLWASTGDAPVLFINLGRVLVLTPEVQDCIELSKLLQIANRLQTKVR